VSDEHARLDRELHAGRRGLDATRKRKWFDVPREDREARKVSVSESADQPKEQKR
jgi:hypothetical protein